MRRAAIVTVGSELVEGLRLDTNTAEIARSLGPLGFHVTAAVSVGDNAEALADWFARLTAANELVVTTGGLGPTHDDITRDAASRALGLPLVRDERLVELLRPVQARHNDAAAAEQVLDQALVLHGAEIIDPATGTAPGLVVSTSTGLLALLPGPPSEMRPMLAVLLGRFATVRALPRELGVVGMTESDAQVRVQRALLAHDDVGFTVLARPGDVRVLLLDEGAGAEGLAHAADEVASALDAHCYATDGSSLEAVVIREAVLRGVTLAVAESCTGGLVAAALTETPGSSAAFLGGVVSYSDEAKTALLDVPTGMLAQYGAVSEEVALAMAEGARERLRADIAVSITGIAGPEGGTTDKPVGLVWFAVATEQATVAIRRRFLAGSRAAVRARAAAMALDLLRRGVLGR